MIPTSARPDGYSRAILADGTQLELDFYLGSVTIGILGSFAAHIYAMGDEPLVGRAVSDRYMVILDHGRQLIVEP
jgi:hypothetical protein